MVVEAGYLPSMATRAAGKSEMYGGGRRRSRIGTLRKGTLMGYHAKDTQRTRRATLRKVVRAVGALSAFRKLNAVAVYSKKRAPGTAKAFKRDRNWVRKTFLSHKSK
jgi:hypothetical protein